MNLVKTTLDSYLREKTSDIHQSTEKVLEPLQLFNNLTLKNYGRFVLIQYKWHQVLEAFLFTANDKLIFDDYNYTPKTPILHKDLSALGLKPENTTLNNVPRLAIPGIIYVLEGSMLGGTVISKHLESENIGVEYRHYFSHCSETAKTTWPLTRKYLQKAEDRVGFFERCLESSIYCFDKMIGLVEEEIKKGE